MCAAAASAGRGAGGRAAPRPINAVPAAGGALAPGGAAKWQTGYMSGVVMSNV